MCGVHTIHGNLVFALAFCRSSWSLVTVASSAWLANRQAQAEVGYGRVSSMGFTSVNREKKREIKGLIVGGHADVFVHFA